MAPLTQGPLHHRQAEDHPPCVPTSEISHHSGALRRLLKRVANPSPSHEEQQQRQSSHLPHWKTDSLSVPRTSPPSRSEPLSPPTSPSTGGSSSSSTRLDPTFQDSTGFVRPVTHTSLGCTSERVLAGTRYIQTTKLHPHTGEARMDADEPPSRSQCGEIGDRKWFRRQLQDLKRWFIRAKVHESDVKPRNGICLHAKVWRSSVTCRQSSTAPWLIFLVVLKCRSVSGTHQALRCDQPHHRIAEQVSCPSLTDEHSPAILHCASGGSALAFGGKSGSPISATTPVRLLPINFHCQTDV